MELSTSSKTDRAVFWLIILTGIATLALHGGHVVLAALGAGHMH